MILLSVFSSLQIWDSLPKPAVFFTSFCSAYFSWLCVALWVSGSTICFLGAQRTFDSFNVTLHSLLSLMAFHLSFSLISHDLSLPFCLCVFLLLISPFFLCFSPSLFLHLSPPPPIFFLIFFSASSSSPPSFISLLSSVVHAVSLCFSFHHPPYLLLLSFQVKWFLTSMYYRNPPSHSGGIWDMNIHSGLYGPSMLCARSGYYTFPRFLSFLWCLYENRCCRLNALTLGRVRILRRLIYSERPAIVLLTHTSKPQWDELLYKHSNMEPLGLEAVQRESM